MIYEYALDPELVVEVFKKYGQLPFENFGVRNGRLLSMFPKRWIRRVYDSSAQSSLNEISRKQLEEMLKRFKNSKTIATKRLAFDCSHDNWLDNALQAHAMYPFRAILTAMATDRSGPLTSFPVEENFKQWQTYNSCYPRRTAKELANAVRNLLVMSKTIVFMDPHFDVDQRYFKPFREYFSIIFGTLVFRESPEVFIYAPELKGDKGCALSDSEHKKKFDSYKERITSYYSEIIPKYKKVTVQICRERQGGQEMHNRFILTEIAGIQFGHGLDESRSNPESRDVLSLVEYQSNFDIWEQYTSQPGAFEKREDERFSIEGVAEP